ncbi:MAG: adenylate/guanylate cyclase domain-containing protein [Clostridiales bacterium]|nr:adenylate/guanylate cyclase domain-containing protein [Clostridiales bacterium]
MKKTKRWQAIISAALAAVLIALFAFNTLSFLELRLSDTVFQRPTRARTDIVVIGIDDHALDTFGRFQDWGRDLFAEAINILNSDPEGYKPAVILLDILFTEHGADPAADAALVEAAEFGGNVITGGELRYGLDRYLNFGVMDVRLPFPELAAVSAYGMVNGSIDTDGNVRHALLWDEFQGQSYYSFAAQVYYMINGRHADFVLENHEMYLAYAGLPGEFFQMSFADLFEDWFDPLFFEDAIVLIGAFTTAMMDMYFTPMSAHVQMNGVEIHANAIQALLDGNYKLHVPYSLQWVGYIAAILISLGAAWFLRLRGALIVSIIVAAAHMALSIWLFSIGWVNIVLYPLVAIASVYLFKVIFSYVVAVIEKQKVRGIFMKYVDPKLVDRLIATGEADSNEVGATRDIAVIFVDVRGFTPMTEALKDTPETVVEILNEYLELTSGSVFNNGGSVDKFIGDATMALFNGFVPLADYEYKAVKAAWDMVEGAAEVNASIKEKYGVDVGFGIGVNCGLAIVGNLGPSFRKDFTAIGDTINTAARLESSAERSQVLISKEVRDRLGERIKARSVGELPLKGKTEKLEIFAVEAVI